MADEVKTEETQTNTKKTVSPRAIFWARFVGWLVFAMVVPVVFLVWKFNLFGIESKVNTRVMVGGWSIVAILVVFFTLRAIIKYVNKGLGYSLGSQILNGITKIILPLILCAAVGYIIFTVFEQGAKEFIIVMGVLIVSEAIAIPLNPFPKWINDHQKAETEANNKKLINQFFDEYVKRKK